MPFDSLTLLPYALLLGSVIALWLPWRGAWVVPFVLAIVFGYITGALSGFAVVPLALLIVACRAAARPQLARFVRFDAAIAVVLLALGLGMHAFPGFHPLVLWRDIVVTPGAAPYTLRLNFDKVAVGVLILGICYDGLINEPAEWRRMFRRAAPVIVATIAVVATLAVASGYVRLDPKATVLFWPWAIVNLFFTCVAEEAFFRGFIQRQLDRASMLKNKSVLVIAVSALLFGISHVAGGAAYVLLATVAGFGYALTFQRTQRIEASILAHFVLNSAHFIFLTYPRLA